MTSAQSKALLEEMASPGAKPLVGPVVLLAGGGAIAAVEYRIALALGVRVGIVEGSGRSAARLLVDDEWKESENLVRLPPDAVKLREFLAS
jgi:hypothetical protein